MTQPTCPDVRNLQALLEAAASGDEPDEVVRHLETCASCQQTLECLSADPGSWEAIAHGLGQPARREPALWQAVEQLKREEPLSADAGELPFLRPADQPGLLGLLGPYEVQEVIGRGGMGVVLKAFDPALNRVVAIKVLAATVAGSALARRRFAREAQAAAAVSHDHIVPIHAVHSAEGLPYLVMQYVAGESLQTRLDRGGPLDVEAVVRIGLQTAEGLAAAHAQGLIHRDIKPANLLLEVGQAFQPDSSDVRLESLTYRAKITDFGLARMMDDARLTQNGVVVGTPEYMAPEQARGEPVDPRADLFSLGSVLYACCTGVPPFRGPSPVAILCQVSEQAPTPVRVRNPAVPEWLEGLIDRLLAKDPAERIQSAAEVAALLEGYLAHLGQPETVPAPALPPLGPSVQPGTPARGAGSALRFGGLLLALALVALGLAGVTWLAADGGPDAPGQSSPEVFYQDFHDHKPVQEHFFLMGTDWEKSIAHEREGLRVNLPATRKVQRTMRGIGLGTNLPVVGDFQITATYQLLSAGTPVSGREVAGVDLYLQRGPEGNRQARFGRFNTQEGPVYEMKESLYKQAPDKVLRVPTAATRGQLRLARAGNLLLYLVKDDTTQGEFKELYQTDFGTEPLKFILFEVNPGQEATPVEARLIDLQIESNLRNQAAPPANPSDPSSPAGSPRGAGRRWLAAAAVFGLFLLLALAGWLYFLRRHQTPAEGAGPSVPNEAAPEGTPFLTFACPGCGKGLKSKPELAGKRVKCPHCGKTVPVAATQPARSSPGNSRSWVSRGALLAGLVVVAGVLPLLYVGVQRFRQPQNYLDRPLGLDYLPGIEEEGLLEPEFDRGWGEPFRWTNGKARLVIPLGDQVPQALNVRLGHFVPRPVRLEIRVNGQPLFEEQVEMDLEWSRTFDLRETSLGRKVVIEVTSDTFIPPSNNARILGVGIRGITLLSGTQVYNNVPLGVRPLPEVAEEGFNYQEQQGGEPFRWTKGSARLTVPIRGKPPKTLSLGLGIPNQKGYRVRVTVNGQKLFDDEVEPNRRWSADLPLDGVNLGDRAEIELTSTTTVPAQLAPGSKDQRILGVNVRRLVLVD